MANITGLAGETRMANDTGLDYQQQARHGINQGTRDKFGGRKYLKEATVIVNVEYVNEERAMDIIKVVTTNVEMGQFWH